MDLTAWFGFCDRPTVVPAVFSAPSHCAPSVSHRKTKREKLCACKVTANTHMAVSRGSYFVRPVFLQILTRCLLCARHCAGPWEGAAAQSRPHPLGPWGLVGITEEATKNIVQYVVAGGDAHCGHTPGEGVMGRVGREVLL